MSKVVKMLMVDDHSLILEGYKSKLQESFPGDELQFVIDIAQNCDEAYERINGSLFSSSYDIVILDINLPPSKDRKILSGEDLGKVIRKKSPNTALIVLTMYSENIRLLNILKSLDPEAFLIKSDITPQEFLKAFNKVREGEVHYSKSIIDIMRRQLTQDFVLDEYDRNILFHLSEGVRTKDLVDIIPLSLAAIEKRKKILKEVLEVENKGDLALISEARKKGFL